MAIMITNKTPADEIVKSHPESLLAATILRTENLITVLIELAALQAVNSAEVPEEVQNYLNSAEFPQELKAVIDSRVQGLKANAALAEATNPPPTPDADKDGYVPVDSSQIRAIAYYPSTLKMRVKFTSHAVYEYENVMPATYQQLMQAKSVGSAFHQLIKKAPHLHPYTKLEDGE